jgi:hypothetical protein
LKEPHIECSWEENIQVAIWSKFMFIVAYGKIAELAAPHQIVYHPFLMEDWLLMSILFSK